MDLKAYYRLISSEGRAKKYLSKKCLKNQHRFCPRCQCRKLYKLQEGRYRCSRCQYTFHEFSGRWINQGRLTCVQWLSLIKLFELEVSVRKMAQQMGLAYGTVYRAIQTIRLAIVSQAQDAALLLGGEIDWKSKFIANTLNEKRVFILVDRRLEISCADFAFLPENIDLSNLSFLKKVVHRKGLLGGKHICLGHSRRTLRQMRLFY